MTRNAVCLISGGIDSCVTSYIAQAEGYQIYGLSFRYGQRHEKELFCAKKIVKSLTVKNHIILNIELEKLADSSLLHQSKDAIKHQNYVNIGNHIPSTYVPARNTVFLSLALAHAETITAEAIYIGANAVDYSGYPDCRPEYLKAFQQMADLATKRGVEGHPIKIEAPLLQLTKVEIIQKGLSLNVPFEDTWSCYHGEDLACGRCDACLLRLRGFHEAQIKDPVSYQEFPEWYTK